MKSGVKNRPAPGSSEEKDVIKVCRLLNKQGAQYLIVGGLACNLHGLIRATKDIDLLIPKDEKNTEKVLEALKELTFGIAGELEAKTVSQKPFTIIGDIPRVDLVTVANKVKFEEAKKTALQTFIDKVKIPYVNFETLLKTKKTGRLQDKADVEQLKRIHKKAGKK